METDSKRLKNSFIINGNRKELIVKNSSIYKQILMQKVLLRISLKKFLRTFYK